MKNVVVGVKEDVLSFKWFIWLFSYVWRKSIYININFVVRIFHFQFFLLKEDKKKPSKVKLFAITQAHLEGYSSNRCLPIWKWNTEIDVHEDW